MGYIETTPNVVTQNFIVSTNPLKAWFTGHSYSSAAEPILVQVSLQQLTSTQITYTVIKSTDGSCEIISFILGN